MAEAKTDVLVFVEDPGAANYLAPIVEGLRAAEVGCRLVARGAAASYLRDRGVSAEEFAGDEAAPTLLARIEPKLLITGTAENLETAGLALIDAAGARGIASVGAVDGPANSAHRFRGLAAEPLAHAPDWLMVADEWTKASYVRLGFPADRVAVCGHPHYDVVRARHRTLETEGRQAVRRRLGLDDGGRAVVLFVAELSTGLDPSQFRRAPDYTLAGRGSDGRTEVVLDELLDAVAALPERPYLVLRLHPKNSPYDFPVQRGAFDLISQSGPALDWAYAADLVVGLTSMLLVEAALLCRPTLSIVPRQREREWLASVAWGVTPCAYEREAVRAALPRLLGPGAPGVDVAPGKIPERCTERAVALVRSLLAGGRAKHAAHEP